MDDTPAWAKGLIEQIGAMRADFDALRAEMATRANMDALRADMDALRAEMGNLATHAELDQLNAALVRARAEIMARIDRLQEALTQQQDESVVNYAASNRAEEMIKNLRDEVSVLTRIVMRLRTRLDDIEGRQRDH
ncbi:DUF1664 domain-containing protein [Leptolyngbya sp. 15MV]|nr:DUF1664 domain-containing protein [Leptolyngbya sp. 15MV]